MVNMRLFKQRVRGGWVNDDFSLFWRGVCKLVLFKRSSKRAKQESPKCPNAISGFFRFLNAWWQGKQGGFLTVLG